MGRTKPTEKASNRTLAKRDGEIDMVLFMTPQHI
jgi:hypothetical protein